MQYYVHLMTACSGPEPFDRNEMGYFTRTLQIKLGIMWWYFGSFSLPIAPKRHNNRLIPQNLVPFSNARKEA